MFTKEIADYVYGTSMQRRIERAEAAEQATMAAEYAADLHVAEAAIIVRAHVPAARAVNIAVTPDGHVALIDVHTDRGPRTWPDSAEHDTAATTVETLMAAALAHRPDFVPHTARSAYRRGRYGAAWGRIELPEPPIRDLPLVPDPNAGRDHWTSRSVLDTECRRTEKAVCLALHYIGHANTGRRGPEGAELSGPHASLWPRPADPDGRCLDLPSSLPKVTPIPALPGDRFRVAGVVYELRDDDPSQFPRLVPEL